MLKVLICGRDSERILRAVRFFRERDIEVFLMPHPNLKQLEQYLKEGVNGVLLCDTEQEEMWRAWLRRNRCHGIVMS